MSFELICHNCGAPSGPSTGVCPFCKSLFSASRKKEHPSLTQLRKLYQDGNLSRALPLAVQFEKELVESKMENADFFVLYAKILIEAEGPSSKIQGLLGRVLLADPENHEAAEYLDLIEAKSLLSREPDDEGEQKLKRILRRSPNNVHALFLLGAHLFWVENDKVSPIHLLEKCVKLRPNFLRAWGCLGALYEANGNAGLASRAFRQCFALETDAGMKAFFAARLDELKG